MAKLGYQECAEKALEFSKEMTEDKWGVEDPVDMLIILGIMTASMAKTISNLNIGYCNASANCLAIDVMLYTTKEYLKMDQSKDDDHEEHGSPPGFMRGVHQKPPSGPVDM